MTKDELVLMVNSTINSNGKGEITGKALNLALNAIVDSMGTASKDEGLKRNDVNFFDYDGTLLYAYTWEEAKNLTELPELPEHPNMTCTGWNYTLEDIKAQGIDGPWDQWYDLDDNGIEIYTPYVFAGNLTINGTSYVAYNKTGDLNDSWACVSIGEPTNDNLQYFEAVQDGEMWEIIGDSYYCAVGSIGKADVGACFVDSEGNAITHPCAHIVPRGVTEVSGSDYSVDDRYLKVISYPNTVTSFYRSSIYNVFLEGELKFPISATNIDSGYVTAAKLNAESMYINGIGIKFWDYCANSRFSRKHCVPNNVINLSYYNDVAGSTTYLKMPKSIRYVSNDCCSAFVDFSECLVVPELDSSYLYYKAIVPDHLYDEWISSTNWAQVTSNIIKVSDFLGIQ